MILPRTNQANGAEVPTSKSSAPKQIAEGPAIEAVVSPGRVRRIAGNITPRNQSDLNRTNLSGGNVQKTSPNTHVPTYVKNSPSSSASTLSGTRFRDDRYGIPQTKSTISEISANQNVGVNPVRAAVNNLNPSKSTTLFKSTPRSDEIIKAAHEYIKTSTHTTASIRTKETYNDLPSLMTDSETFDTADGTIDETDLYRKFKEAFDTTLRNNPGMLPGAPSIIQSIQNALIKVTKSMAEKENEMRKRISTIKMEKEHMESELSKEMGSLAVRKNELAKELEKAQQEKDRVQDSLSKQQGAILAIKRDLECKMGDVTREKEELTKHLGFLSKSRAELEAALETEMKLVEKDRDALQKFIAERKMIQRQKAENKELESKIEVMTEAASKEKAALQAEVAELKAFESHLLQLKKNNDITRKELEQEKRELMEMTRTLQTKKTAVMESRAELEKTMEKEIQELEIQIENTRLMHAKDMENLVKRKVVNFLQRGGAVERDDVLIETDDYGVDIETMIKTRVEAELKWKEIELKEKEMEMKERELKEREIREREMKEIEMKEQEMKEREMREREMKEREMKEREMKEREMREREMKEREMREREMKERAMKEREMKEREMKELERKEREMKELEIKERKMKEKEMKEREAERVKEREEREKTLQEREKALLEREARLHMDELKRQKDITRRRRFRTDTNVDDEGTIDDQSADYSHVNSRSSRISRGRKNDCREDDESTVASTENQKKRQNKKREIKNPAKEAELQKELDDIRQELSKNKNQTENIEDLLKKRRESAILMSTMKKYLSPEEELRKEIASLREEIKMSHRESPAFANSPDPHLYRDSPRMASYVPAPPQSRNDDSSEVRERRGRYDNEIRTPRERYEDDDDVILDSRHALRSPPVYVTRRGGYEEDYRKYDREPRLRSSSRVRSPRPLVIPRSPVSQISRGIIKSNYYM